MWTDSSRKKALTLPHQLMLRLSGACQRFKLLTTRAKCQKSRGLRRLHTSLLNGKPVIPRRWNRLRQYSWSAEELSVALTCLIEKQACIYCRSSSTNLLRLALVTSPAVLLPRRELRVDLPRIDQTAVSITYCTLRVIRIGSSFRSKVGRPLPS